MKRFSIIFLAIAVAFVMALPAGAKGKPDKPPKPPASAPIAVYLDAEPIWVHEGGPMWVHEGGDVLRYTVTLQNKTSADIDDITVRFSAATTAEDVDEITVVVPANEYMIVPFVDLSRDVLDFAATAGCAFGEECELLATATVLSGSEVLTQETTSTPLMPYPACGFDVGGGTALVSGVCIWTVSDDQTGIWEVSLDPTPPKKENRPIDAQVAVRDGVPGNWCVLPDDAGGGVFSVRWKTGDGPVDGKVYLPGDENLPELDEGVCLAGGAGGEYIATGNPHSFYLRANGIITVTLEGPPPSTD